MPLSICADSVGIDLDSAVDGDVVGISRLGGFPFTLSVINWRPSTLNYPLTHPIQLRVIKRRKGYHSRKRGAKPIGRWYLTWKTRAEKLAEALRVAVCPVILW